MMFFWIFLPLGPEGSSAFIAEPKDIKRLLLEKFNALAQTYADDLTLEFTPQDGVELSYAFRLQPDPGPVSANELPLRLGPILQDTSTRVIFEYIIEPKAVKSDILTFLDGMLKVLNLVAAHARSGFSVAAAASCNGLA